MFAQHFTLEQIAVATEKTIDEVKEIIENYKQGVV
jgi:hypothetical protein